MRARRTRLFAVPIVGPEGLFVTPEHKPGACDIEGNISRKGEKIYHMPGSRSDAKTVISEGAGEHMFCSEDEAKAAGWRAARGGEPLG